MPTRPWWSVSAPTTASSPREHDVCLLLGRGRNRQFVADELGISLETAKTHATNVYRKLGVHSRDELIELLDGSVRRG